MDGSFAWLFFKNPMPGASTITVHVIGDTILAQNGGQTLDADDNGTAGGTLEYRFTTVSVTRFQAPRSRAASSIRAMT